jgi:hypothetical protein
MKALVNRELPEAARQVRETQDLLKTAAEEILTLLETWDQRPADDPADSEPDQATRDFRALITSLFEKMSFQDLAGQRLAKVEDFLKALGEIVRPGPPAGRVRPRPGKTENQPGRNAPPTADEKTLKGPQAAGGGLDQKEIEALLADLQG